MEGDGMVAIIQGLKDANLAVTLMNKDTLQKSLKPKPVFMKSSVETNTITKRAQNIAAQDNNDHYTSSYQAAHCNFRQSSLPERLSEFPPQRARPSRDLGNFVGGYGRAKSNLSPGSSHYSSQDFRGEMVWPDRGSFSRQLSPTSMPAQSDPFVQSLRKYPPLVSPESRISTELVQRLLSYTQNKHFSVSDNSRWHEPSIEEKPTRDIKTDTSSVKNIQTYTRAKAKPTALRDKSASTSNEIKFDHGKKGRSFSSNSPYHMKARAKSDFNDSYDYLKSSPRSRHADVRYFNEVKKYFRQTIQRQIYNDETVCPHIKRRYMQHQKEHHKSFSENTCPDAVFGEARASAGTSNETSLFDSCQLPTAVPPACPKQHKRNFCKTSNPCSCKTASYSQHLALPEIQEAQETSETTAFQARPCTCKSDNTKGQKIADEILSWLKGLPVYADDSPENKSKREEIVTDLANKLKAMEGDRNYETKAKEDINKCIDKLPIWYPGSKRYKEMFKNQLTDDLSNRLATIDRAEKFKDVIGDWFDEIQFETGKNVDKNNIVENLVHRLKPLVDKPNKIILKEIEDMLQELPIYNKSKVIGKLSYKLSNQLTNYELTNKELESQIMDWLKDIPELSSDNSDNKIMGKSLAKKLKRDQKHGVADGESQEQLKEKIIDWIDSILKSKGKELDSETKNKITNKLLDRLMSTTIHEFEIKDRKSSMGDQNDYETHIWNWLEDVVDSFQEVRRNHRKQVKSFAEKLNKLISANADDEVVESEIKDFLKSLSKKGVTIPTKNKDKHIKKLISIIKSIPKAPIRLQNEDLLESILSVITEVVEDKPSNISKSNQKGITNKVSVISANNKNVLSQKIDNINRELVNILMKEANISEDDAFNLASALINRIKEMQFQGKSRYFTDKRPTEINNEMNQYLLEEVKNFLNDHNLVSAKKDVEKNVNKDLNDQIGRGTNSKQDKYDIISIFQDTNKSENDVLNISNKSLEKSNKMSLTHETPDEKLELSESRLNRDQSKTMYPLEREYIEDKAEKEILDFIEELTDHDSPISIKKKIEETEKLVHKLDNIMSNPNKEQSIIEEVSEYFKKLSIVSDLRREEMAQTLANRLQGLEIGYKASTPKNYKHSFCLRNESISAIRVDDNDSSQKFRTIAQGESDEEKKYANKLIKLIQMWIDELSINLNATDDKGFKETMIQDLTSDIIDRQKYLQLNSDAKTSDLEELENLKYQVFRWLNKLLDIDDMTLVMQRTEPLMRQIRDIYVPKLIRPTEKRSDSKILSLCTRSSMLRQDSSQFVSENLIGAIQDWLKNIPLYQRSIETEKRETERLIPELVRGLKSVLVSSQDSAVHVDELVKDEIMKHLKYFPMNAEHKSDTEILQRMATQLLDYLKGLQLFTDLSDRQNIRFYEDLKATLEAWHFNLPLVKMNSTEMMQFENLKKEIAKNIKQIREQQPENENEKLRDTILSYLPKFPIAEDVKANQKFINNKIEQLVRSFLAVASRTDLGYGSNKFVKKAVSDWIKSLPLAKGKSENDIPKKAVDDLTSEISNLLVRMDVIEINRFEKSLENATKIFLKSVPLDSYANVDVKSLAETLLKIIKELFQRRSTGVPAKRRLPVKVADILFDSIERWCDSLPRTADAPEEIEQAKKHKQEIASKLKRIIGELNMNPEVFNDDFLYEEMLKDAIDDLLSDLSSKEIKNNLPAIKKNLIEKMIEVRQKTQEEVAGQKYKQQLREVVSKTLPSHPLSDEEQAAFEVLKDNLVDAFINLHYIGRDKEFKNKYKIKINDEVRKFCNDYLKKHPASPIDSKQLNQYLYNALKEVPVPKKETVRKEVELVKIKDEVNNWIKELLLNNQTAQEEMKTNKLVVVLANKIYDIEKQKEAAPEVTNYENKTRAKITKWIEKLQLTIDEVQITKLIDKLINNLISSEKSRRVSTSDRNSIISDTFDITPSGACTSQSWQYPIPPSTLSLKDKEHLQRIRERSPAPKAKYPLLKVASVSKGQPVKAADILFDSIASWCDSIPLQADVPEEIEQANKLKQEIASKLIHKISELNMNPEVFNDDFIYDEMLEDAIDDLLSNLSSKVTKNNLADIKKDLMEKIKKTRQQIQEEIAGQAYKQQIREAVAKTLLSHPLSAEEQAAFEILKDNLADAFIHLQYVGGDEISKNKYQIKMYDEVSRFCNEYLKKHPASSIDNKKLNQYVYNALKEIPLPKKETIRKEVELLKIKDEVNNWIKELPLNNQTAPEKMKTNKMVAVLAKRIHDIEKQKEAAPNVADYDVKTRKEITKWIHNLSLRIDKAEVTKLTDKLINNLKSPANSRKTSASARHSITSDTLDITSSSDACASKPGQYIMSPSTLSFEDRDHLQRTKEKSTAPRSKYPLLIDASVSKDPPVNAEDILFNSIESWCDSIPLEGVVPEEIEEAKKLKQEIASQLIHKIGELNMNPEVFNNDFLYDEMLEDAINDLLSDLPSEEIKNKLPAIKKDLMEKIKEARQKTQEEVAGKAYKQKLCEAVSKTLTSHPLSDEEQVYVEVLKDNLADAFINLHYTGGNEELKNKYINKINNKVSMFCNDYLKKHPGSSIDSKKLNQYIYNALKEVPLPKEETIRTEVELVKIKDEIKNCIKELPLHNQTAQEKMKTNKIVAILAKKIHDIEKHIEAAPDVTNYDDKMKRQITKWIKKLPLAIDNAEVIKLTDKLMTNLKRSEKSRRVSASARHSITSYTFDITQSERCTSQLYQNAMPTSTLSYEDREHLQRIRKNSTSPRYSLSKVTSMSPLSIDAGSQTEIRTWEYCQATGGKQLGQQSSGIQTSRPFEQKMQAVGSQAEVSPYVIVKEYYWDSADASRIQEICPPRPSPLTTSGLCSPPSKSPRSQRTHISPRTSLPVGQDLLSSTPPPRRARKEWEQPNIPGMVTENTPEPCTSKSCRAPYVKVTRLGSFDDMEPYSRMRHEWKSFPEEDEFWGDKRKFTSDDDELFLKERKKKEEKLRCRCRERILTKCVEREKRSCPSTRLHIEDVKKCYKCCGAHCPHPSYLYFK